ncbi:hypothetical protein Btru_039063 [Bulinus truncatus]|nr:hypothetical protein Btru_039063 [Bulinus truncatus]
MDTFFNVGVVLLLEAGLWPGYQCDDVQCAPAEEGSTAGLNVTWRPRNIDEQIMIYYNESEVTLCSLNPAKCVHYLSSITAAIQNISDGIYYILVSMNTTFKPKILGEQNFWTLKYLNDDSAAVEIKCVFTVFVKPRDIQCDLLSGEDIYISCTTSAVYPKAICIFNINSSSKASIAEPSVIYHHTSISNGSTYYTSTCIIFVPVLKDNTGDYSFTVTMYPNISEKISDIVHGRTLTLNKTFEPPNLILQNCPTELNVGNILKCACVMSGLGSSNVLYTWHNASTNVILSNTSLLTLVMSRYAKEFLCMAKSNRFNDPLSRTFTITVTELYQSLTEVNGFNNSLTVDEQSSLQVTCRANLISDLKISWTQSGTKRLLKTSRGLKLVWAKPNVSQNDAGIYECRASNGVKIVESNVTVLVKRFQEKPKSSKRKTIRILSGQNRSKEMFRKRFFLQIAKLSVVLLTLCLIGYIAQFKYLRNSLNILYVFKLNYFSKFQLKSESSNYVIKPEVGCDNAELVLCVLSRRWNYITRHTIRKTWGSYAQVPSNNATLIFFLGSEHPSTNISDSVQPLVDHEAELFGDILQEDYIDSYYNLTLKSMSILRWISLYCPNSKFLLKSDDDMYINVPLLHHTLNGMTASNTTGSKFIVGHVVYNGLPDRWTSSKFYVSMSVYNKTVYPTYATGPAYAMTTQTAKLLYSVSWNFSYFFLEDVFITGMCADVADVPRVDDARFLSKKRQPSGCLFRTNIAGEQFAPYEINKIHREINDTSIDCI